jgi:putative PIN family toxin of toxin-antitoxin system
MTNKIVLDTNALIQCLPNKSPYRKIWNSIIEGKSFLCVSNEILEEYEEILGRMYGRKIAELALLAIINRPSVIFITPYYHFHLIEADPDDNKFVDCAISANAKFIVTEDHHFDILKRIDFPKVEIIKLEECLKQL